MVFTGKVHRNRVNNNSWTIQGLRHDLRFIYYYFRVRYSCAKNRFLSSDYIGVVDFTTDHVTFRTIHKKVTYGV